MGTQEIFPKTAKILWTITRLFFSHYFNKSLVVNIMSPNVFVPGAPSLTTALHMVEPCLDHDNTLLVPVVLSTWMPEKVGGMAGKSLIFAETQVCLISYQIKIIFVNKQKLVNKRCTVV